MKRLSKTAIMIALSIILLATILAIYVPGSFKNIQVNDRCGLFVNKVVHTIETSDACKVQCKNQCQVTDFSLLSSEFVAAQVGCNQCTCKCIKYPWGA